MHQEVFENDDFLAHTSSLTMDCNDLCHGYPELRLPLRICDYCQSQENIWNQKLTFKEKLTASATSNGGTIELLEPQNFIKFLEFLMLSSVAKGELGIDHSLFILFYIDL